MIVFYSKISNKNSLIKILSFNKVISRSYPGSGKPMGHARNIFASLNKKTLPNSVSIPQMSASTPQPVINEVPFTEIKFDSLTPQVMDKTLSINKIKSVISNIIPSTRTKSGDILTTQQSIAIQGKEAIYYWLEYFHNLPQEYIKSPDFFILYHKHLTEKYPELYVRAYQLAFEIYCRKRQFNENDIVLLFDNKISVNDIIGRNQNIADMSTVFSFFQANHLLTQPGFKENVSTVVVIPTCTNSADLKNLPPEVIQLMDYIKKLTGNTVNDINLNGHPYDFKLTYDPTYSKNHIIFMPSIEHNYAFNIVSNRLSRSMRCTLDILDKMQHKTSEDLYKMQYITKLRHKLQTIAQENMSDLEKYYAWNKHLYETLHLRLAQFSMPLFIPLNSPKFQSHVENKSRVEEIELSSKKVLQAPDIQKAIMGVTTSWPKGIHNKAYQDTDGLLGKGEDAE